MSPNHIDICCLLTSIAQTLKNHRVAMGVYFAETGITAGADVIFTTISRAPLDLRDQT